MNSVALLSFSKRLLCSYLFLLITITAIAQHGHDAVTSDSAFQPLDIALIEKITGLKPFVNKGECIVSVPQNDLSIEVSGFKIIPPMGLGTSVGFTPLPDGAMVMGDIVLTENDLEKVQQEVIRQGLTITAVHNHFMGNYPAVMWMHIGGSGSTEAMAMKVKAILDRIKETRGHNPADGIVPSVTNTIDTLMLRNLIGPGRMTAKGVYRQVIERTGVVVKEHGIPISSFLGLNMWFAWQGTSERAAVAGEYTLQEDEVAPVVKALVENGIGVVAIHSHMVHEQPRFFFLHCWGIGPAEKLATGIKTALEKINNNK
jgi:hypothetical protein